MPCYFPIPACLVQGPGGRTVSLDRGAVGKGISLPCSKCIGCRLERSRQWAVRLMHESEMHESSSFITLTYDPKFLPKDRSLKVSVAQYFMKRLRLRLKGIKIRFFLCGEYGDQWQRPHYHAIIFGYDFPDRTFLKKKGDIDLFHSNLLDEVWAKGYCTVGSVTFDSCAYVARYAMKKIHGAKAAAHYYGRLPEFLTMSRRPGIGHGWIKAFSSDVFPSDEVIVKGFQTRPPRYYDQYLEATNEALFLSMKAKRDEAAFELEEETTVRGLKVHLRPSDHPDRLKAGLIIAETKAALKSRPKEF